MESLDMRLKRLERSNRVWRGAVIGLALFAVALGIGPVQDDGKTVCRELVVNHPDSDFTIQLGFHELDDGDVFPQIAISNGEPGQGVCFVGGNDDAFVAKLGGVSIMSYLGESILGIGGLKLDGSQIRFEKDGELVAGLGMSETYSGLLELYDENGGKLVSAGSTLPNDKNPLTVGSVRAFDPNGIRPASILEPSP